MGTVDFAVVGSSGGGGTIAWLLARAGFSVMVAEAGPDIASHLGSQNLAFNPVTHDENRFRLGRPPVHRRPRGDYNTFRKAGDNTPAAPFANAWTATVLGGGSVIWGTWSFRALPIDFRLGTHFTETGQAKTLQQWGYSVPDWPVSYQDIEPYYNVAETLLAVSGDRKAINASVKGSDWYHEFQALQHFGGDGNYLPQFPLPCKAYPVTPVGDFVAEGFRSVSKHPAPLPSGMVSPGTASYSTRDAIAAAVAAWDGGQKPPEFWAQNADRIWSDRVRDACNMCGFCGEYLCWGSRGPKSSSRTSTIRELQDLPNADVRTSAKVFEITMDRAGKRATGIRYLDVTDPDAPKVREQKARHVIVAAGAVQTARLLLMSGPPHGLGNSHDQVGRYATFHLFGYSATCVLPEKMQGYLHSELGHTGSTMTFADYFVKDELTGDPATAGKWWKAGTLVSTAKKNPLDGAAGKVAKGAIGMNLIGEMEKYNRSLEIRLTGDDLPMAANRIDLDPSYVDEYGLPVARITRDFGRNEMLMFKLMTSKLKDCFHHYKDIGLLSDLDTQVTIPPAATVDLIGDHQMGTARMGDDRQTSVVDRWCRLHDVPNVFVTDSSIFPTGFGLNPMVTVVANALRVGTWIAGQAKTGAGIG